MQQHAYFFVGPIPPPLHGFSAINLSVIRFLASRGPTQIFNRAPRFAKAPRLTVVYSFMLLFKFVILAIWRRPTLLYLGISGGKGQLIDLAYLSVGRLLRIRIIIHHHSFLYINSRSRLMRACVKLAKGATHVVLCGHMKSKFSEIYDVSVDSIIILSNSAFLSDPDVDENGNLSIEEKYTVGFFSNITEEKGIFDFLSIVSMAQKAGLDFNVLIGGPVDPSIRFRFDTEVGAIANLTYLGALYDRDKIGFFSSLDLLLFPSKYKNEAEPVTIFEALSHGVEVLGTELGCCPEILKLSGGACASNELFSLAAMEILAFGVRQNQSERMRKKKMISRSFYSFRASFSGSLNSLVDRR